MEAHLTVLYPSALQLSGEGSEVDCENPDYEKYPLFQKIPIIEVTLNPCEVIFIPVGWWHSVKSLDISILQILYFLINMNGCIYQLQIIYRGSITLVVAYKNALIANPIARLLILNMPNNRQITF